MWVIIDFRLELFKGQVVSVQKVTKQLSVNLLGSFLVRSLSYPLLDQHLFIHSEIAANKAEVGKGECKIHEYLHWY